MSEPTPNKLLSVAELEGLARSFQQSRILLSAHELGVFAALNGSPASARAVAAAVGADPRATRRLLDALCVLGILEHRGDDYANSPAAARFLVPGSPDYGGGLGHIANLWDSWGTLTDAVRCGHALPPARSDRDAAIWRQRFIGAMHHFSAGQADALAAALDLSAVSSALDIGGGSGAYAMALATVRPGLAATVFDLPEVLPLTRGYIAEAGLTERVSVTAGDYRDADFGEGFDLILLSSVIHINSPATNRDLFRRCAAALTPGGQLVIKDFLVNEERTGPPQAVLFALNMLVNTEAGDTYSEAELRDWLWAAGLGSVERVELDGTSSVLVARSAPAVEVAGG